MLRSLGPAVFLMIAVTVMVPSICSASLEPIRVPEPATALLIAAGAVGAAGFAGLRRRSK
jgi:hypothetical protein